MKIWLANLLWDALCLFLGRVHDWAFSPGRAAAVRFRNREIWWAYTQKAQKTPSKRDDMRAKWYRIVFDLETPPAEAIERGDLEGVKAQIEQAAVQRYLDNAVDGPAADRANP